MAFVVLLALCGGVFWWRRHQVVPVAVTQAPPRPPAPVAPSPPPPPPAPAIRHPLPKTSAAGLPSLDASDGYFDHALSDLLGRKQVREFLHLDGVARRFVATVNNLATDDASASLWPVKPIEGRFETEARGGEAVIAAGNAERYTRFVRFADGINARWAVALYLRAYPLLQQAYEDLGYPGKYFNDRLVEVIDNLLATPTPAAPIAVKRLAPDGGPPGSGLYVYEDAALETASAGQKILLRMGRDNAAVLTAKLREIRALLVARPPAER